MRTYYIPIKGLVQGVGIRPLVSGKGFLNSKIGGKRIVNYLPVNSCREFAKHKSKNHHKHDGSCFYNALFKM